MADANSTATTPEKLAAGSSCILDHFYDLRALAMSASAMTHIIEENIDGGSDELNAIRRTLQCLSDNALQFANEADEFFLHALRDQESEAAHA